MHAPAHCCRLRFHSAGKFNGVVNWTHAVSNECVCCRTCGDVIAGALELILKVHLRVYA